MDSYRSDYNEATPRTFYNLKDFDFNDTTNSWACGENVVVDFCNNNENDNCYDGHGMRATGPAKSIKIGMHDK